MCVSSKCGHRKHSFISHYSLFQHTPVLRPAITPVWPWPMNPHLHTPASTVYRNGTRARTKRTSELKSPGTRSWSAREQVSLAQSNIKADRRQRQPSITSAALFSLTSSTKAEKKKRNPAYFSMYAAGLASTENYVLPVLCARLGG